MGQSVNKRINGVTKPAAYWETIRDRIDTGAAVTVLNSVVTGDTYREKPVTAIQATMAWNIVQKLLPSMAAIQVEVSHRTAATLSSLTDRAAALGIDHTALLGQPIESIGETVSSVPDKVVSCDDSLEGPLPPDSDA
jgi:hypothetical protein